MALDEKLKFCISSGLASITNMVVGFLQAANIQELPFVTGTLSDYSRTLCVSSFLCIWPRNLTNIGLYGISCLVSAPFIIHEIAQKYDLARGVYDEKDIIAYTLGGLTSLAIGLSSRKKTN